MHIGKKNPMTSYFMRIENACSEEKDLGITFDSNLNFDTHMNEIY